MIVCANCGHGREFHFIFSIDESDEDVSEDLQPCTETYGSGRWRCRCDDFEPSNVRVGHVS